MKAWLARVAPFAFPDVVGRMSWVVNYVYERWIMHDEDLRYVVSDPVESWWPGEGDPALGTVYELFAATRGTWTELLEVDSIDQLMFDSRHWLGLKDAGDDE